MKHDELIYDWNEREPAEHATHPIVLNDETLRDGLQNPSVLDPTIEQKIEIMHAMASVGVGALNLGLPGAGPRAVADVTALAEEITRSGLALDPNCAARTHRADIEPIAEVVQRTGVDIEAAIFIGASHIRQFVEGWDLDVILKHTEAAIRLCQEHGLRVMYVTEDTTRTHPAVVDRLFRHAIEMGAQRVVLCDTVGHADPAGAAALVRYMRAIVGELNPAVKIDWHGHRDRGLDVPNAIAAYEAGADRVHACALGVGERAGNCAMEILMVNLALRGSLDHDLTGVPRYCALVSDYLGVPIPNNYPVVGSDAFETATGVHAAAVVKALRKGDEWLANRVYSGVPADMVGLGQRITIGPMSGKWNVIHWLETRGHEATDERVAAIFDRAKRSNRVLTDAEIEAELQGS